MEPRFAWDEDIAVAPHRVLRIPFADDRLRPRQLSDAVVAEVDGRTVLALPGLGPDNRAVLGALDLESGALLPDRSGLRSDALSHVVLSGGLLAGLGSGDTVIVRDAASGVLVREIPRTQGRSSLALGTVDGRPAVFAPTFGGALAWDVATGEPVATAPALPDDYLAGDFLVEHQGRMLVLARRIDGPVRFFDALTGEAFGAPFRGHPDGEPRWVAAVAYQGRLIVASRQSHFDEHPILLWDAGTGAVVLTSPPVRPEGSSSSAFEAPSLALVDGRPLLLVGRSGDPGRPLLLWDPVAGSEVLPELFAGYDREPGRVVLGALDRGLYAVVTYKRAPGAALWVSGPDGERRGIEIEDAGGEVTLGRVAERPTMVFTGGGGMLRLVDVETLREHPAPVYGGPMDTTVAAGTVAGRAVAVVAGSPARLWDLATGVPVARLERFTEHDQRFAVGRAGDRDVLAVLTRTALTVWDLAAGAVLAEIAGDFEPRIGVVLTEAGGRTVVAAHVTDESYVRTVRSWDAVTGAPAGRPYRVEVSLDLLAAGRTGSRPVVFASTDAGPIRVVDPATGTEVLPPLTGHDRQAQALAYGSFDGRAVLVSGGRDQTVRVWDAETGEALGRPYTGHTSAVASVHLAEHHGEPVVVSTAQDGEPRMWMLRAAPVDPGHTGRINALAGGFRAGVPVFASGADDMTVRLWDVTTGRPAGPPLTGHRGPVVGVVFAGPDRDVLVSADATGLVLRRPPHPGAPHTLAQVDGRAAGLATAVVDGREVLAVSTFAGRIEVVDATTGAPYATLDTGAGVGTLDLGVVGGRLVALAISSHHEADQGSVTVWDVRSGEPLHPAVVVPENSSFLGAFGMLEGRLVIVHGIDAENDDEDEGYWEGYGAHLNVYDAATREVLARMELSSSWNQHIAVSGEVALIATDGGSDDDGVYVTDLRTGEEVGRLYRGHGRAGVVHVATVEAAGRVLVASADGGNAVHIWDLEDRTRRLI